jgi:hypothetical protein
VLLSVSQAVQLKHDLYCHTTPLPLMSIVAIMHGTACRLTCVIFDEKAMHTCNIHKDTKTSLLASCLKISAGHAIIPVESSMDAQACQ